MKKLGITLVGTAVVAATVATAAVADTPIQLIVNGHVVHSDEPPQMVNGRTLVPVRWVAEALGADVQWDGQTNAVVVTTRTPTLEEDLISNYLREADTPKQFVENFARALQDRNGAAARLFLVPEIRDQIRPEVIGVSTPIKTVDINESTGGPSVYIYSLKAYYDPYGTWPSTLAFEMNLTVEPEKHPDGTTGTGRYFITNMVLQKNAYFLYY